MGATMTGRSSLSAFAPTVGDVVVVACWPLDLLGASGPTLNQMLVVKAAYCGLLGFAAAR
jgi:hypothetical protein